MLKKDIKVIKEIIALERECGHILYDLDDYKNDLQTMAEDLGVEMVENEECEYIFKNKKDEQRVKEALDYYYEMRG